MRTCDLIIIGGGIIGLATARDAALRGLKVLLLEKEDFGSGASTKTSKLAHGGLRYLETCDFALVRESLRERNLLFKNAQGLAYPLRFLFPVFQGAKKPSWMIRLGLTLYDLFGGSPHQNLSKETVEELYPFLKPVKRGFHYCDGTMKDSRLLIENMLSARDAGAVCLNYTTIDEFLFEGGKVAGVGYAGKKAYAKTIVNATGSSADHLRAMAGDALPSVTRSKGVHLVLKKQFSQDAVLLLSSIDGRVFFLIPWEGVTLLGTTDTEMTEEYPTVTPADIDYLLKSANCYLSTPLGPGDIASTFAGVRPLVRAHGGSRSVQISLSASGLMTVIGGKYTTFRSIAEQIVNRLTNRPCQTASTPFSANCAGLAVASGLHVPLMARLKATWSERAGFCLEEILTHPRGKELICKHFPLTLGELIYTVKHESVRSAEDWQFRRTTSGFMGKCTDECRARITSLIGEINADKTC